MSASTKEEDRDIAKLRSLGVTSGEDDIRRVLKEYNNDIEQALKHLQTSSTEMQEMEIGTEATEDNIVVVEDHFGNGNGNAPPSYSQVVSKPAHVR